MKNPYVVITPRERGQTVYRSPLYGIVAMSNVRQPAVAGEFYRGTASALETQVTNCFTSDFGPGSVPEFQNDTDKQPLLGLVSPHAGLQFSGPIAAHGYARLAERGVPETVVLLGPDHQRLGSAVAAAPHDAWQTPLGTVEIDDALRSEIVERSDASRMDGRGHEREHSLEVQLPFLQYWDRTPEIVPITVATRDSTTCTTLGESIAAAVESLERDVTVIASTDLTHYEPPSVAKSADEPVIELLTGSNPDGLLEHVERTGHSMCGPGATATTLAATNALDAETATEFAYATSGDIADTHGRSVGYCSIGFE